MHALCNLSKWLASTGARGESEREHDGIDTKQDFTYTGFRVFGRFEEQLARGKQSDMNALLGVWAYQH